MSSLAQRPVSLRVRWNAFISETEPSVSIFRFSAVFFGIWAAYDLLDLLWNGTAANYWLVTGAAQAVKELRGLQSLLLMSELGIVGVILMKKGPRGLLLGLFTTALLLRTIEAVYYFGLNDFYYYSITVLILLQFFALGREARLASWPREILRYQTAWIYFVTGVLKLNPHWLSGDHLWIRQMYLLKILHWPEPAWLQSQVLGQSVARGLAVLGVTGELSMGVLLAARAPRWLVVSLAVLMHGFAALALNVWFFGASMIAQVAFVSRTRPRADSSP